MAVEGMKAEQFHRNYAAAKARYDQGLITEDEYLQDVIVMAEAALEMK